MHLYLTARHFDLTDNIRDYVQQRLVQSIEAHADRHDLNRIEVQLTVGQREVRFGCHVLLQLPGHRELNVSEEGKDMYAAIDQAEKRLLRALIQARQRQLTVRRQPKTLGDRMARALRAAR